MLKIQNGARGWINIVERYLTLLRHLDLLHPDGRLEAIKKITLTKPPPALLEGEPVMMLIRRTSGRCR